MPVHTYIQERSPHALRNWHKRREVFVRERDTDSNEDHFIVYECLLGLTFKTQV